VRHARLTAKNHALLLLPQSINTAGHTDAMTWRVVTGEVLLAAFVAGTASVDVEPDGLQALVVAVYVVGLVGVGYFGGWWALPTFAIAFFVASAIYGSYFWHDDPRIAGIDDIDPTWGYALLLPFVLVPIALGALARRAARISRQSPA
jgi:hypothetical protein